MKNLLKRLEESKFIDSIHMRTLWVDTMEFMEYMKDHPDSFEYTKSYRLEDIHAWDLRVKFNVMASGFYQYLQKYCEADPDNDLMLTCNIDEKFTFVAFKGKKNLQKVVEYYYDQFNSIPVHDTILDLDYNSKIHILMYDKKFKFPEISLN